MILTVKVKSRGQLFIFNLIETQAIRHKGLNQANEADKASSKFEQRLLNECRVREKDYEIVRVAWFNLPYFHQIKFIIPTAEKRKNLPE